MSSEFTKYSAIIPAMFVGIPEVQPLIAFLSGLGLIQKEGQDLRFKVEECDGSEEHYLDLPDDGDKRPPEVDLLQQLINTGKICLMYESRWSPGDGYDEEEAVRDLVSLAESISTLTLREVLAKRLGLE